MNEQSNIARNILPLTPKGGGVRILGKRFQDWLIGKVNSAGIIQVVVPQTDGTNVLDPKFAEVKSTPAGTIITMPAVSGQAASGPVTASLSMWKFQADQGSFIFAYSWDGVNLGIDLTAIAKPPKLQLSPSSNNIRGVNYNYTYTLQSNYYVRGVTGSDGSSSNDIVIPDYLSGDIIFAVTAATGVTYSGIPVTLQDINVDGRAWAAQ